mmetsp:Transcript_391/g.364  ORF Transcript_391/g.364 Transcript_391/m.364 type:complete len:103 (+) Transcript_391:613-921(+)
MSSYSTSSTSSDSSDSSETSDSDCEGESSPASSDETYFSTSSRVTNEFDEVVGSTLIITDSSADTYFLSDYYVEEEDYTISTYFLSDYKAGISKKKKGSEKK